MIKTFYKYFLFLTLIIFSKNSFSNPNTKNDSEFNKAINLVDSINFYFEKNQEKYDLFVEQFKSTPFKNLIDSNFRKVIFQRIEFLRRNYKYREGIPILNTSVSIAASNKDTLSMAYFHKMLSSLYYYIGNNDSSKYQLEQAYALYEHLNDNAELGIINIRKARIEYDFGNYEEALRSSFIALKLSKLANDGRSIGVSYLQLGNTFYYLTNYRDAKKYFELASETFKGIGYDFGYNEALSNTGLVEIRQKEYRKGMSKEFAALKYLKQEEYAIELGVVYSVLVDAYFGLEDHDSSYYYNNLAIEQFKKSNYQHGLCLSYLNEADVFFIRNEFEKALKSAQIGFAIAIENSYSQLLQECNLSFYKIYKKLNNQSKSYFHLEEYVRIKDSLNFNPYVLQGDAMKYQLDAEEAKLKQQLAEEREKIHAIEGKKTKQQLLITKIIACITLISFLVSIYFLFRNKKLNKNLSTQRERISKELKEKEALLSEIHHRVKNNLQVISSMLSLQAQYITDISLIKIIEESRGRIISMSLIHESLYKKKDFKEALFSSYIEELTTKLVETYCTDVSKIDLSMDLEPVKLSLDDSIPCGLIINEIISNSLKHAFPDGNVGTIKIELKKKEEWVYLTISDDGVGLAKGSSFNSEESFGFLLIEILASQLKAELAINTLNGFSYHLKWEG